MAGTSQSHHAVTSSVCLGTLIDDRHQPITTCIVSRLISYCIMHDDVTWFPEPFFILLYVLSEQTQFVQWHTDGNMEVGFKLNTESSIKVAEHSFPIFGVPASFTCILLSLPNQCSWCAQNWQVTRYTTVCSNFTLCAAWDHTCWITILLNFRKFNHKIFSLCTTN